MTDFQPLQELERLLGQSGDTPPVVFPPNSRYQAVPLVVRPAADGTQVVYIARRFVPPPEAFATARRVTVGEGDRLDNLAARELGDPELFWRLCDANRAVEPAELEIVGRDLGVPLPAGVPAPRVDG